MLPLLILIGALAGWACAAVLALMLCVAASRADDEVQEILDQCDEALRVTGRDCSGAITTTTRRTECVSR